MQIHQSPVNQSRKCNTMQSYQLPPKPTKIIHYDSTVGIKLSDILVTIIVLVCTLCGNCDVSCRSLYILIQNGHKYHLRSSVLPVSPPKARRHRVEQKWGYGPSPSPMHLGLNNRPSVPKTYSNWRHECKNWIITKSKVVRKIRKTFYTSLSTQPIKYFHTVKK